MWLGYLIGSAWLIFVSIFFIFFLRSSGKLFCSLAWPLNPVRAGSSHSFGCGGYGHKWRTCTCIRTTLSVFVCSPVILIKMRNLFCVWVLGSTFRGVAGTAFTIYGNFIRVLVFRLSRFVFVAAIEVNKLAEGSGWSGQNPSHSLICMYDTYDSWAGCVLKVAQFLGAVSERDLLTLSFGMRSQWPEEMDAGKGDTYVCRPQLMESCQWERDWNWLHDWRNSAYSLCRNLSALKPKKNVCE